MAKSVEVVAKTVDEAIAEALEKLQIDLEDADVEIVDEGSKGVLGIFGSKGAKVIVTENIPDTKKLKNFLSLVLGAMGIEAHIDFSDDGETVKAEISGEKVGAVIGYHGETLQAITYIANLVINKGKENFKRVYIDVEGYRKSREEYLVALAKRTADRVAKYKRSITLDAMPAHERHVVHEAIQNFKTVTTVSKGKDPFRCVVVLTKAEAEEMAAREEAKNAAEEE